MYRQRWLIGAASLLLAAAPLSAQTTSPYYVQGLFGAAFRDVGLIGSNHGVSFLGRGGFRLTRNLGLITEASVTSYARRYYGTIPCARAECDYAVSTEGLAVMGLAVGLQPSMRLGPVALMASATIGAYAPYTSTQMFPNAKAGLRGSLGVGVPISGHVQALVEAGGTHFMSHSSKQTDGLAYNIGLAIQ